MIKTVLGEDDSGVALRRINVRDWESLETEYLKELLQLIRDL